MNVSEISSELDKKWDALEGKMRASLFNLIVVTPKNSRTEYVKMITHKVLERFPSRVIFITVDHESKMDSLNASVSLIPGDVICDFIEIDVTSKSQPKIPFVILPHFLPDLPIYLLWADDPDSKILPSLEKFTTRVIFDSEVAGKLKTFAKILLEQQRTYEIADLNWGRTQNWRELLSSTFYSPARLDALRSSKKIKIVYNDFETPFIRHTKIQATYLQGWLTTQLDLKNVFDLVPQTDPNLPSGTVISIDIITSSQVHFAFTRDKKNPHHVKSIICDTEKCEIPTTFIFTKTLSGFSLVNEITYTGTNAHFLKVIQWLS